MLKRMLFTIGLGALLLSGCAGKTHLANPDFGNRIQTVKKVGVVIAEAKVFELNFGGSRELKSDWTAQALANLETSSISLLNGNGFESRLLQNDEAVQNLVGYYNRLQRHDLIKLVAKGEQLPEKSAKELKEYLDQQGLDALVLVRGVDNVSSAGRQSARVVLMMLGSYAASAPAIVDMAVVDRSGTILFFDAKVEDGQDLRKPDNASYMLGVLLERLQELRGITS